MKLRFVAIPLLLAGMSLALVPPAAADGVCLLYYCPHNTNDPSTSMHAVCVDEPPVWSCSEQLRCIGSPLSYLTGLTCLYEFNGACVGMCPNGYLVCEKTQDLVALPPALVPPLPAYVIPATNTCI